jgi:hypothetical protein
MDILVNADGRRNTSGRPYIQDEELKRNVLLYDPNNYNLDTGLYDRPRPACARWVDYFHQDQLATHRRPFAVTDGYGKMTYSPAYYHRDYSSSPRQVATTTTTMWRR